MKLTLTREEMLERCRLAGGLEPLRTDCTIEYTEGISPDSILEQRLRSRYLQLLDAGTREMVAADNIAATVSTAQGALPAAGVVLTMPAMCRRVFDVQLRGWSHPVAVRPYEALAEVMNLQQNPYTRATATSPVAVFASGALAGASPAVLAWPAGASADASPQVAVATAVIDPGPDYFTLDEAAIDSLINDSIYEH